MAQGSSGYVDDIPIALSNKWNMPPMPSIPESCVVAICESHSILRQQSFAYDYSLERIFLEKVEDWKKMRYREIDERDRRIILRQEEKRKQLEVEGTKIIEQLTKVSYDIGSFDDDKAVTGTFFEHKSNEKQKLNSLGSILIPTILNAQSNDKHENFLSTVTINKSLQSTFNIKKDSTPLKLADFENDNSDPFNTMELKTMDDLNILEQVLKTSIKDNDLKKNTIDNIIEINEIEQQYVEKISEEERGTSFVHSNYENLSSCRPKCYESKFISNHYKTQNKCNSNSLESHCTGLSSSFISNSNIDIIETLNKQRSKSVPDIESELEKELDKTKRKTPSRSQLNDIQPTVFIKNITDSAVHKNEDSFLKDLPKEKQLLSIKISQMGYPLDRVCRVAQYVHGDDKKIIEHLILLSELLDLGFEEKNISAALVKFNHNKEKALDFLIS